MDGLQCAPRQADTTELWTENRAIIKSYFFGQGGEKEHTLVALRAVLIEKHAFPEVPLNIYETRIRDVLQLRKRMQKEDWWPVWTHCLPIMERGGTPAVYFHGRLIPSPIATSGDFREACRLIPTSIAVTIGVFGTSSSSLFTTGARSTGNCTNTALWRDLHQSASADLPKTDLWTAWKETMFRNLPYLQILGFMSNLSISDPLGTKQYSPRHNVFTAQLLPTERLNYVKIPTSFFRPHDEDLQSTKALTLEIDQFHFLSKAIFRLSNRITNTRTDAPSLHVAQSSLWDFIFNHRWHGGFEEAVLKHTKPRREWLTSRSAATALQECDAELVPNCVDSRALDDLERHGLDEKAVANMRGKLVCLGLLSAESDADLKAAAFAKLVRIGEQAMLVMARCGSMPRSAASGVDEALANEAVQTRIVDLKEWLHYRRGRFQDDFLSGLLRGLSAQKGDGELWSAAIGLYFWRERLQVDAQGPTRAVCGLHSVTHHSITESAAKWAAPHILQDTWAGFLSIFVNRGATICPSLVAVIVGRAGGCRITVVETLLHIGLNLAQVGPPAMAEAAADNDRRTVAWLIKQGVGINGKATVEINYVCRSGSIIYCACYRAWGTRAHPRTLKHVLTAMRLLHELGANLMDTSECTRLLEGVMSYHGVRQDEVQAFKDLLVEAHLDFLAAAPVLVIFLQCGAPTELSNFLLDHGSIGLAKQLVALGANPFALGSLGSLGRTALHAACWAGSLSASEAAQRRALVEYLLDLGVGVDKLDADGWTALHYAANNGDLELAIVLLDRGAAHSTATFGYFDEYFCEEVLPHTALDLAAKKGRLDMVQLLLNVGATSAGRTNTCFHKAIELACYYGHVEVAKLLRTAPQLPEHEAARRLWLSTQPTSATAPSGDIE
ncbi:hypothetical protein Micbo1qcDRAFT_173615 [Microdochium bolleyi]|uniref:Uncharacterized protein n=1 Tax=Microdochium bolleyi TaxID=196109 RepID=A0A136JCK3_9PEZI|nr:hypothetical protein Micbo1qcDRAFT_173615 [Microdochium bolleyi]